MLYNSYAKIYKAAFQKLDSDKDIIRKFAEECPIGDILEIGAGTGRTLGFVLNRKHVLLESNQDMLTILREEVGNFSKFIILEGKSQKIPTSSESFAGIFATFGTFGELSPICATLQEIKRVLIQGGHLYFSALNPDKYSPPNPGIAGTKTLGISDFSLISGTFSYSQVYQGEFQTLLWVRGLEEDLTFTNRQYFPTLQQWKVLFEQLDLTLESNETDLIHSDVFHFYLKRPFEKESKKIRGQIAEIYDSVATIYDKFVEKSNYSLPKWLESKLDPFKDLNPRILDLACGNGLVAKLAIESGVKPSSLIGYDISEDMVIEAQKSSLYNNVIRFDLNNGLPGFSAMSIDLITAFGLMEFIDNPYHLLKDIKRTLTPGGTFLCAFECGQEEQGWLRKVGRFKDKEFVSFQSSKAHILDLFQKVGLEIETIERKVGYRSPTTNQDVDYYYVVSHKSSL